MNKAATFLLVAIVCIGDLFIIGAAYRSRATPPPRAIPPHPASLTQVYLSQVSSLMGQATAAMDAGNPERAAILDLQAANLCITARTFTKGNAELFNPSSSALMAKAEWQLAHPDSAHVFDQVVDLLTTDKVSPAVSPAPGPLTRP